MQNSTHSYDLVFELWSPWEREVSSTAWDGLKRQLRWAQIPCFLFLTLRRFCQPNLMPGSKREHSHPGPALVTILGHSSIPILQIWGSRNCFHNCWCETWPREPFAISLYLQGVRNPVFYCWGVNVSGSSGLPASFRHIASWTIYASYRLLKIQAKCGKGHPHSLLVGYKLARPPWKSVGRFLKE